MIQGGYMKTIGFTAIGVVLVYEVATHAVAFIETIFAKVLVQLPF